MRVSNRKLHFCLCLFMLERERETGKGKRRKGEKNPKPYKNRVFKVVIQKCEKSKKWILSKNCLTLFVSGREKKRAFLCTLSVLAKIFGPKTVQSRKHYKNRGFSGNCKKSKNDTFLGKGVFFDMVEKVGFTNCVFWKAVFSWKHLFIVFSAKHSFRKNKNCMFKKTENF